MKQQILKDIVDRLNALQLPFSMKEDAQIAVGADFVDIGNGTDLKKVRYELTIILDEGNQSVHLYVSTVVKYVLSMVDTQAEPDTKPQTIFRKVKHLVRDADGKESIITLDLADVPNTVKNAAIQYGWKFSTVLNMNKSTPVLLSASEKSGFFDLDDELDMLLEREYAETHAGESAAPVKREKKRSLMSKLNAMLHPKKPKH
jgi:hypothetical protein